MLRISARRMNASPHSVNKSYFSQARKLARSLPMTSVEASEERGRPALFAQFERCGAPVDLIFLYSVWEREQHGCLYLFYRGALKTLRRFLQERVTKQVCVFAELDDSNSVQFLETVRGRIAQSSLAPIWQVGKFADFARWPTVVFQKDTTWYQLLTVLPETPHSLFEYPLWKLAARG
jgi:hypothetical protein